MINMNDFKWSFSRWNRVEESRFLTGWPFVGQAIEAHLYVLSDVSLQTGKPEVLRYLRHRAVL